MYCFKCGKENKNDSKFCRYCGQLLNVQNKQAPIINSNNTYSNFDKTTNTNLNNNYNQNYNNNLNNNNMHSYSNSIQVKKSKPKRKGLIITIILSLIIIVGLLIVFSPKKQNVIETYDNVSGKISINNATLTLPDNQNTKDCKITVSSLENNRLQTQDIACASDIYQLEGNLDNFNGKIKLEIQISDEDYQHLKSLQDIENKLHIIYCDDTPSYSDYNVPFETALETHIDLNNKIVWTELDFNSISSVQNANNNLFESFTIASLFTNTAFAAQNNNNKNNKNTIKMWYETTWTGKKVLRSDNFKIYFEPGKTDGPAEGLFYEYLCEDLMKDLEDAKKIIEGLGFSFKDVRKPFPVNIKKMKEPGNFTPSKFHKDLSSININRNQFQVDNANLPNGKEERYDKLKASAAHELFHVAQNEFNQQWSINKGNDFARHPFVWLDEACSKWIEGRVLGDNNYLPEKSRENINFIHSPLYFDQNRVHGYGAMFFIKYLENELGNTDFIINTYKECENLSGYSITSNAITGIALDNILKKDNKFLDIEWIKFISKYIIKPNEILPTLNTKELLDNTISLSAKDIGEDDISYSFKTSTSKRLKISSNSKGSALNQTPAKITATYSLENLSADTLRIRFDNNHEIFNKDGDLKIDVKTTNSSGVLVYDNKGNCLTDGMWGFLSDTKESYFKAITSLTISDYNKSKYTEIILIPINFDVSENRTASKIVINISYSNNKPSPTPTPEPTPIPEPKETPSSNQANDDSSTPNWNPKDMLTGIYNCIGTAKLDWNYNSYRYDIKESDSWAGNYEFLKNGKMKCVFIDGTEAEGTYKLDSEKVVSLIVINDKGIKYNFKNSTLATYNVIWYDGSIGPTLNVVNGEYIFLGSVGFGAYKKVD